MFGVSSPVILIREGWLYVVATGVEAAERGEMEISTRGCFGSVSCREAWISVTWLSFVNDTSSSASNNALSLLCKSPAFRDRYHRTVTAIGPRRGCIFCRFPSRHAVSLYAFPVTHSTICFRYFFELVLG